MSKKCSHNKEFQLIAPKVIIDPQSQVKRNMIFKYINLRVSDDGHNDCSIQGQAHKSDEAQVDRCQFVGPLRHQGAQFIITDVGRKEALLMMNIIGIDGGREPIGVVDADVLVHADDLI